MSIELGSLQKGKWTNRILSLLIALLITASSSYAQAPTGFSYQAVVRDGFGNVLASRVVNFRISILEGSSAGASRYTEIHTIGTNEYGLANLTIGNGQFVSGDFAAIAWSSHFYFMQVEIDINGGSNFEFMGTSQLLSVPYALHAKTAENGFSGDYNDLKNKPAIDNSSTNELQTLTKSGSLITLSNGGGSVNVDIYSAGEGLEITTGKEIRLKPAKVRVGQWAFGGFVFFVDASGTHGLVVSDADISTGTTWYEASEVVHNPLLTGGNFFDWRLPSKMELFLIHAKIHLAGLGNFNTTGQYWSGTDSATGNPGCLDFSDGTMKFTFGRETQQHVRAVRAF